LLVVEAAVDMIQAPAALVALGAGLRVLVYLAQEIVELRTLAAAVVAQLLLAQIQEALVAQV
jgi:hypothetical protein